MTTSVRTDTNREAALLAGLFGCLLFALLTASYWIYSPGLSGPLVLDDFGNLQSLGEAGGVHSLENFLRFVFSNDSGPTGRPVSMLSFLIDAQDWPPLVRAFKYTNLMVHLLTGVLLCWFTILLGRFTQLSTKQSAILGLITAALWLLHPLNVSTTLYVIQRMTQLMTMFSLAALICYLYGRQIIQTNARTGMVLLCLALFPFGLLSVLSKENGALLLLLIVVLESTLLQNARTGRWFRLWYRTGVLLPLGIVIVFLLYSFSADMGLYDYRQFNLGERLMTETRVIWIYIAKILLPNTIGAGLYHDDFLISQSLLQPISTLFALLTLAALFGSALYLRRVQPVFSFAILWFFSAHLLESSYLPLELYFEHRNYLAMMGPLFAVVWYLHQFYRKIDKVQSRALQVGVLVVLAWCAMLTYQQSRLWGNTLALHTQWAVDKPTSVRAQLGFADTLKYFNEPEIAMERLQLAHEHYPQEITILLYMWNLSCEFGLPAPYSLAQIAAYPNLEYVRDDVNQHLKTLITNLIERKCSYPDEAVMVSLFERIGEFSLPDLRRSGYHFYFSDLYVYYGRLNAALINLTRAFEANPIVQIPIRQALLSASANNFNDALVFIGRAREADANRNPMLPSSLSEIEQLEADFCRRLAL